MTFSHSKKLVACLAILTLSFAATAQAGNAFNKFPAQATAQQTQNIQVSIYDSVAKFDADVVKTKRRVKRVVQAVPSKLDSRVAYASDHGTTNMDRSFNKMAAEVKPSLSDIRVLVDERAHTAR